MPTQRRWLLTYIGSYYRSPTGSAHAMRCVRSTACASVAGFHHGSSRKQCSRPVPGAHRRSPRRTGRSAERAGPPEAAAGSRAEPSRPDNRRGLGLSKLAILDHVVTISATDARLTPSRTLRSHKGSVRNGSNLTNRRCARRGCHNGTEGHNNQRPKGCIRRFTGIGKTPVRRPQGSRDGADRTREGSRYVAATASGRAGGCGSRCRYSDHCCCSTGDGDCG